MPKQKTPLCQVVVFSKRAGDSQTDRENERDAGLADAVTAVNARQWLGIDLPRFTWLCRTLGQRMNSSSIRSTCDPPADCRSSEGCPVALGQQKSTSIWMALRSRRCPAVGAYASCVLELERIVQIGWSAMVWIKALWSICHLIRRLCRMDRHTVGIVDIGKSDTTNKSGFIMGSVYRIRLSKTYKHLIIDCEIIKELCQVGLR